MMLRLAPNCGNGTGEEYSLLVSWTEDFVVHYRWRRGLVGCGVILKRRWTAG